MKIITLIITLFGISGFVFSQKVERNPQKSVKSKLPTQIDKPKEISLGDSPVNESVKKTETHADGTKSVIISFTEKTPFNFDKIEMEQQRVALASLNWTKEELSIYLKSLEKKRSSVSKQSEAHALALQNGWYAFMDSIYIEAFELHQNFNSKS